MSVLAKRPDRFTETEIDDEVIVMRLDTGEFFSMTDTAAATWRLIDGSRDRAGLLRALVDEYGVKEAKIAAEIDTFLVELRSAGLVS
ncbi:PqqD family protein [Sphingomonas sp. RB56-2]|uniref:PqqD family protein n=1 Tax=Sphingomonas brevis TaxID=2908206 RepID=A0ABT0S7L5_9SPHN|nr:PqqD family protein [Sphingomonas brevis]MCL6740388.1 PqqD family protein [Sphingomonas brevis]